MDTDRKRTILSAENISKEYIIKKHLLARTVEKFTAVHDVSFDLKEGKTIGIVGESGSGKSTTGEMIGGLLEPSFGNVYYKGKNIKKLSKREYMEYRKNIQFIFQDPKGSMDPNFKIADVVSEPLFSLKICGTKVESALLVDDMLDKVGLSRNVKNKYPSQLSGGQCQRAAIARALAVEPEVIICDEPVSALDVSVQAQILNLLKKLQKELDISYIFISHDIGVVNYMADEIIVFNKGNIVEKGDAKKILLHSENEYTKKLIKSSLNH